MRNCRATKLVEMNTTMTLSSSLSTSPSVRSLSIGEGVPGPYNLVDHQERKIVAAKDMSTSRASVAM
jgi:hypothetical protein